MGTAPPSQRVPRSLARNGKSCAYFARTPLATVSKECDVSISAYLKDGAYGPEAIAAMAAAFDDVCKAIEAAGRSDVTRDTLALKIIDLAPNGESDAVVLREMALTELGLTDLSKESP